MELLYVFVGGGLGSVCRYGIGKVAGVWESQVPLGTILANVVACLILGMLVGWSMKHGEQKTLHLFLAVGFCGGFSTFSTFSLENVTLWQQGDYTAAITNILVSLVVCVLCVLAGIRLTGA